MALPTLSNEARKRYRRRLLWCLAFFVVIWIFFFDSHSLLKRIRWHHEYTELKAENAALRAEIDALNAKLAAGLSDGDVEKIAREEYGMRKPGETVYRVEKR